MAAPVAPTLNCDDLPELALKHRSQVTRGTSYACIGKLRTKTISLPKVAENIDEDEQDNMLSDCQSLWACSSCTFLNNDLLSVCEVCQVERFSSIETASQFNNEPALDALQIGATLSLDWPALSEARVSLYQPSESWVDCDTSSVASSWLDIGGHDEQDEDDEFEIVTTNNLNSQADTAQTKKPTDAPLWSAVVGKAQAPAAKQPVPSLIPPTSRKAVVRPCRKLSGDEECDAVLDELDARRMAVRHIAGSKRARAKKR